MNRNAKARQQDKGHAQEEEQTVGVEGASAVQNAPRVGGVAAASGQHLGGEKEEKPPAAEEPAATTGGAAGDAAGITRCAG